MQGTGLSAFHAGIVTCRHDAIAATGKARSAADNAPDEGLTVRQAFLPPDITEAMPDGPSHRT